MKRLRIAFCLLAFIPSAGPARAYDAVLFNATGQSQEVRLLAMTLAGIVNRDSSRLYLLNCYETWSYQATDETWRDIYRLRGGARFDSIASVVTLVDRFRPFLRGGVSYDASQTFSNFPGQVFRWQAEYAALIGGLTDRLPVTASLASLVNIPVSDSALVSDAFDTDSAVYVTCRLELSSHPWNNTAQSTEIRYLTLLDWGVRVLLPRCNPGKFYIREITDFAVRHRMFQVNLAGTDALDLNSMPGPRADILERVLAYLHGKNPASVFHIYGWIQPEPMTQWFAWFGSSFHETLLGNLSWHSSFPVAPRTYELPARASADTAELRDRHYLLFVGSEGDASNWTFGFQSGAWLSSQRGSVPLGWGWNLELFRECPFVAAYYYDTATPNDGFLAVTSPLGYAFPDLWQSDVWQGAVDSTLDLMRQFDTREVYGYKHYAASGTMVYRGKTIRNSFDFAAYGAFQSATNALITFFYDPLVATQTPLTAYGPLMFNHLGRDGYNNSFYMDASDLSALAALIIANIKKQTPPAFLFAAYQRLRQDNFAARTDPGSSDISVPRLAELVGLIRADPEVGASVEVVTPQTFRALLRKKLSLSALASSAERGAEYRLLQNFPNPCNPSATIRYSLPDAGTATIVLYDALGREVRTLEEGERGAGTYSVQSDVGGLASGTYFYRLTVRSPAGREVFTATRRMLLLH